MCVDYNVDTESLFKLVNREDQKEKEKIKEFIKCFYNFIYNSDLKVNDRFLLYIAEDAYNFILKKEKKESKLKISNVHNIPAIEGSFTIIKITNDDMPFLVDSVIATIKSHGSRVTRNLHHVNLIKPIGLNVLDILNHECIMLTSDALKNLEGRLL